MRVRRPSPNVMRERCRRHRRMGATRMTFAAMSLAPGLRVRELEARDEPAVSDVFTASEDYFVALTGDRALSGDVQSLFYAAPEGVSPDAKLLLVAELDCETVGVIDVVPGHPGPD